MIPLIPLFPAAALRIIASAVATPEKIARASLWILQNVPSALAGAEWVRVKLTKFLKKHNKK